MYVSKMSTCDKRLNVHSYLVCSFILRQICSQSSIDINIDRFILKPRLDLFTNEYVYL